MMLSYHYWLCMGKNGSTKVKSVQRDPESHSACGCLALHPTLWSLFNTFHTKRYDGFVELSHISLQKEMNRLWSLHIPALHLFPALFMSEKEPMSYRAILCFCIQITINCCDPRGTAVRGKTPAMDGPSVQLGIHSCTVAIIYRPITYQITKLRAICLSACFSPSTVSENRLSW